MPLAKIILFLRKNSRKTLQKCYCCKRSLFRYRCKRSSYALSRFGNSDTSLNTFLRCLTKEPWYTKVCSYREKECARRNSGDSFLLLGNPRQRGIPIWPEKRRAGRVVEWVGLQLFYKIILVPCGTGLSIHWRFSGATLFSNSSLVFLRMWFTSDEFVFHISFFFMPVVYWQYCLSFTYLSRWTENRPAIDKEAIFASLHNKHTLD